MDNELDLNDLRVNTYNSRPSAIVSRSDDGVTITNLRMGITISTHYMRNVWSNRQDAMSLMKLAVKHMNRAHDLDYQLKQRKYEADLIRLNEEAEKELRW